MKKIANIIRNELMTAFSNKMIFLCFLFSLLAIPVMNLFKFFSVAEEMKMIKDFSFSIVALLGIVLSIFYPSFSLREDFERKYIYNILSKPISRTYYVIGKIIAFCVVITIISAVNFAVLYALILIKGYSLSLSFVEASILLLFKFYIIIALSAFFGSMPFSYHISSILTLFLFILGTLKSYVLTIIRYSKLGWASKISLPFLKIAPNFQLFDVYESVIGGDTVLFKTFLQILLYGIFYFAIFVILTSIIVSKKEL